MPFLTPEGLLARVLYRDKLMLAIDKPAGLPVHAGPGGGDNLEEMFDALRFGLPRPPSLAHRLDRDTSGCLVLGRHRKALRRLGRLFSQGLVEKTYWAVTDGAPDGDSGAIDAALKKIARKGAGWRMVVAADGQNAVTGWRVLGRAGDRAWLELRPLTGRTHQIRIHLARLGCPVTGDEAYGKGDGALLLHARAISLPLYPDRPPVEVTAPLPDHMRAALAPFGFVEQDRPAPPPASCPPSTA